MFKLIHFGFVVVFKQHPHNAKGTFLFIYLFWLCWVFTAARASLGVAVGLIALLHLGS